MYRCIALIDQQALLHNLMYLRRLSGGAHIIVMVKANAYGHGLKEVASILKNHPFISFGVAAIEEAIVLRNAGANNQILLFDGGASRNNSDGLIDYDVTPMISDKESLILLEQCLERRRIQNLKKVHLKVDTGFTRLGLNYREILAGKYDEFIHHVRNSHTVRLAGIATHFCSADSEVETFTDRQIANFRDCVQYLSMRGVTYDHLHMANSAAILRNKSHIPGLISNGQLMVRPGLASYGINPFPKDICKTDLKAVMSIKAQIVALKTVDKGQGVGYGHSFIARNTRTIAIVAIGYGDGLRRSLSNRAHVLYRGKKAPIVGTISMDSCAIDVTDISSEYGENSITRGDCVTILGKDGDESIDVTSLAKLDGTVAYEIFTSIAERLKRQIA